MWSKAARSVAVIGVVGVCSVRAAPSLVERDGTLSGLDSLGISSGCQTTLQSLISSPASTCLNLPGTLAIFTTVANSSWIPPINTWLSNFCGADSCTDDELTSTLDTLADGCSDELNQYGVTKDYLVQEGIAGFPLAKQALCLRDSSNDNDLCAITTLENLQTAFGQPLTPQVLINNLSLLTQNDYALAKQLACTPCASAAFAIMRPVIPEDILSTVDSFVGDQCGQDFTSTPTGSITVVTGTAAVLAASATASTSASTRLEAHGTLLGLAGLLSLAASLF